MSNEVLEKDVTATHAPVQEANRVHQVAPVVDILETRERYEIIAEVPGVTQQDISLRIEGDALYLSARAVAGDGKVRRPWKQVHYVRSFRLGRQVDREQVQAELSHGLLRITLNKVREAQPRQIEVHVGEPAQN